ncbi:DUF4157 domain-containing protein [Streptomyces sp. NPDC050738]|uniref:eCIS core domain-containing protein n=1 Tax=Streptomyces sp. NPDC050738 TaxID=3154744 RepID=UPI0034260F15
MRAQDKKPDSRTDRPADASLTSRDALSTAEAAARLADTGRLNPAAAAVLQRAAGNAALAASVQRSTVPDVLRSAGTPLDESVRTDMESRLGADFSDVRLHTDAAAKASAAEVGARAYTSGSHVVIGEGGADRHTLAHELTHVIQQRQGPVAGTDNGSGLKVSDPSDRFERDAEANAVRALSGQAPDPVQRLESAPEGGAGAVQRAPDWKNTPTKNALAAQKALAPLDPLINTLHHIVPKSDLAEFASWLDAAQLASVVSTLRPVAATAFTSTAGSLNAVSKALKNVPANLVLGPRPETRMDDPGSSGADLNFDQEGSITPRSEELEKVYDFIVRKRSSVPGGTPVVTTAELNSDFLAPIVAACTAHGPGVGLDPNRAVWAGDQATRDQRRTKPIEPLI